MLMQQVREVMTFNQEMTDESSWIWLTLVMRHDVINAIITARRSDEASSRMYDSSSSLR